MDFHGSKYTFNLEIVLLQNIQNSEYYNRRIRGQCSFEETVDEIYTAVQHVEPWMSGNARGPSTAFCLLFHLFTLDLNSVQIKILLDNKDSPYIRAIGLLYLRYVCKPKDLWDWFEPYLKSENRFKPSPIGTPGMKEVTIGEFARDIVLTHNYFETLLPRFPEPLIRDWTKKLININLPFKSLGNGGQGGVDRRGMEEPSKRPASVKASLSVGFKQRAPNRRNAYETAERRNREGVSYLSAYDNHKKHEEGTCCRDRSRSFRGM
jgi:pre-mRNA-splicing factor 38B